MKYLLIIAALLAGCSGSVTPGVYRDSEARCAGLGGLEGVSTIYSGSYYFVEALCQNGTLLKFTVERGRG